MHVKFIEQQGKHRQTLEILFGKRAVFLLFVSSTHKVNPRVMNAEYITKTSELGFALEMTLFGIFYGVPWGAPAVWTKRYHCHSPLNHHAPKRSDVMPKQILGSHVCKAWVKLKSIQGLE